ncbi:MAG: hypothetical protein EOO50_15735 [Flavobacterium sp.]|uniref:tetratricopeptide repeat protein n=1 Tax=Flavobacterium sp. TaxID=239 RepID=UPI0012080BDB|nr:hypothetical protein [Flavobacterium sp.]RZJ64407.1 MAG: hypothetical protein EOO50_15735 [Flavobacterium sp.]
MKNFVSLFVAIVSAFSFGCFAQTNNSVAATAQMGNAKLVFEGVENSDNVIVGYHVEEKIYTRVGVHVTLYTVSSMDYVRKYDLGPGNTRVITPVYGKAKPKPQQAVSLSEVAAVIKTELPKASASFKVPTPIKIAVPAVIEAAPVATETVAKEKKSMYVNINIIDTYEHTLEKGYKSVEMLLRVGNSRFYEGDLVKAARWYTDLYAMTKDLEPTFYYRFAKSLEAVNQKEKAKAMMKIFEEKK